jgi:hypothetical protein
VFYNYFNFFNHYKEKLVDIAYEYDTEIYVYDEAENFRDYNDPLFDYPYE